MTSNLQLTEQWHKARLGKFTASNFSDLLGKGKKKDEIFSQTAKTLILKKLAERLTGEREEIFTNKDMQWGIDNERNGGISYEMITGNKITEAPFIKLKGYEDYCGGSPDGLIFKDGVIDGIIEIKCPKSGKHIKTLFTGQIPEEDHKKYYTQMQLNILVVSLHYGVDIQWCDFISFDPRMINPDNRTKIIRINRDEKHIALILERLDLAIKELEKMEVLLG